MLVVHVARFSDPEDLEALVFTAPRGGQLRQKAFRAKVLKPALKKAGLPTTVRTHDLRHTAVAIAIGAGLHPKQIQEMLGHSTIQVTFDTYGHLFDTLHGAGAERLDEILRANEADASVIPFRPSSPERHAAIGG
jgi:integrase